ncbi:MAG: hypothetical protein IKQ44_00630 [Lachnospiraceae bacterium]|nr:hypothetical protein [Lachnospiraceae bacterium]
MKEIRVSDNKADRLNLPMNMYMKMAGAFPVLRDDEEKALFIARSNGDENALQQLLASNLRYVVQLSGEYSDKGITLEDLILNGNNALLEAINTFDHNSGESFREFALIVIKKAMENSVKEHEGKDYVSIEPPFAEWEDQDLTEFV